jgi:phenylalanyl-tRNA synthetase beta chain
MFDLDDVKGAIELVCRRLGIGSPTYAPLTGEPLLQPGRAAIVTAEDAANGRGVSGGGLAAAGLLGELHPLVADDVDLRGARLIVAELDIAGLAGGRPRDRAVAAPPRYPAAERDLAVVVDEGVPAATVERAIRGAAGPDLVGVRLFDVYRGAPLDSTDKSLAWRLVFQSPDRTLTDAEVDDAIGVVTVAVTAIGGRIRT